MDGPSLGRYIALENLDPVHSGFAVIYHQILEAAVKSMTSSILNPVAKLLISVLVPRFNTVLLLIAPLFVGHVCNSQWRRASDPREAISASSLKRGEERWISLEGPWEACESKDMAVGYEDSGPCVYTIGGANRGLLVTRNEGDTWSPLPIQEVVAIACVSSNPQTVYAAHQNGPQYIISKSNDNGITWTDEHAFDIPVSKITLSPSDPAVVFVGLGGEQYDVNRPLWRSSDGGGSWNAVASLNVYAKVSQIAFDTETSSTMYVTTRGTMGGIWKSTDGGTTWSPKNNGITNVQIASLGITHSPQANVLYAGTYELAGGDPGIYSSTDGGDHWTARISNSGATDIVVDPVRPNLVFAATKNGILCTENFGASWSQRSNGVASKNGRRIIVVQEPDHQVHLLLGTRAAFYRSDDHGNHWSERTVGMAKVACYGVASNGAGIFSVAYGGGENGSLVHHSSDGSKWSVVLDNSVFDPQGHSTFFGFAIAASPVQSGVILASGTSGDDFPQVILRSSDAGNSWERVYDNPSSNQVCNIVFDPDDDRLVYTADLGHVLKSTNSGLTWESLQSSPPFVFSIRVSATSNLSTKTLYAGGSRQVFKSEDGGKSWSSVSNGLPGPVLSLACDPVNPRIIYAGTNHHRVYWTTDGGSDWHPRSEGIYGDFIQSLVVHPERRALYVCASDYYGAPTRIYRSTNLGETWRDISAGLRDAIVYGLEVDDTETNAIIAAADRGIFRFMDDGATIAEVPDEHSGHPLTCDLEQNYPNPFNPTTKIGFEIAAPGFVTLTVYGVLGKEVRSLVNEELNAGRYQVTLDATGLASGVYFYRMTTASFTEVKRMLVLK